MLLGQRLLKSACRSLPAVLAPFERASASAAAAFVAGIQQPVRGLAAKGSSAAGKAGPADKYARAPDSMGSFKSPIVQALWGRRGTARELEGEDPSPPIDKRPSDSRQVIKYAFSSDQYLTHCYQVSLLGCPYTSPSISYSLYNMRTHIYVRIPGASSGKVRRTGEAKAP